MAKVKRMFFGGIAKGLKNAVANVPAPQADAMNSMLAGKPMGGGVPVPAKPSGFGGVNYGNVSKALGNMGNTPAPAPSKPSGFGGVNWGNVSQGLGNMSNTPAPVSMLKTGEGRSMGNRMGRMKKGGKVSSASSRADGIAVKGKTRGKMV
jgi:hypothetical protein